MKKTFLITSVVLFAVAAIWYFLIGPNLTVRVYDGWTWNAQFIGINNYAWDAATDTFTGTDPININKRDMIASLDPQTKELIITDLYATLDPNTNQPTWEFTLIAPVDPKTGAHTSDAYSGSYFLFPRNVQKITYVMRFSSYPGVPVDFVQEENIEGLNTYMFAFKGAADYGFAYISTPNYAGIDLEPGQEIKCWDDQLEVILWVEPVTGEVVKEKETCLSGDYVYEKTTGKKVYGISRWAGEMTGDALIENVANIRAERNRVLWLGLYIPILLALAGIAVMGYGFLRSPQQ